MVESLPRKAKQQMFGKRDLVEILSRDLARARNKRDALASNVITLTAEIAVLEASVSTENDRRERERAAREIERIKRQLNDQYLAFVPSIAGIRGATEMAAAIAPKARELNELLVAIATEVGNAIDSVSGDLDRRIDASHCAPERHQQNIITSVRARLRLFRARARAAITLIFC